MQSSTQLLLLKVSFEKTRTLLLSLFLSRSDEFFDYLTTRNNGDFFFLLIALIYFMVSFFLGRSVSVGTCKSLSCGTGRDEVKAPEAIQPFTLK